MAGKLSTNYIPFIIPQSCAKLPDRIIWIAALPATVAADAACDAFANCKIFRVYICLISQLITILLYYI
jgi:hypothetical protein